MCLSRSCLITGDFYNSLKYVKKGNFVYLDPPYAPISKTAHSKLIAVISLQDQLSKIEA